MLTKKQKLIGTVALAVVITIVFAWANLTLPLKEAIGLCLTVFAGLLLSYPWQRRKLTFRRLTLSALVVAGVMAAMFVTSNLLARYVF